MTHPETTTATDVVNHHPDQVVAVKKLAATFAALGQADHAASLDDLVANLTSRAGAVRVLPVPPGWEAVTHLAALVANSPSLPHVGDRVRLTFPDRVVTGVWMYRNDLPHGQFLGQAVVVDDETGDEVQDIEAAGVEIIGMGRPVAGWDTRLREAALVLRSAWTTPWPSDGVPVAFDPLHGCYGCTKDVDEPGGCTHGPGCTCNGCFQRRYERTRHCACGSATHYTVNAWSPIPQYAAEVGVDEDDAPDAVALHKPGTSGMGYVCSEPCARTWIADFRERAVDRLPTADLAAMLYEMKPWTPTPSHLEVPVALDRLRNTANKVQRIANETVEAWIPGPWRRDVNFDQLPHLHDQLARAIDAAVNIPARTRVAKLWPESVQQIHSHPDEPLAELGLAMQQRVDADPGRYQLGARVVFDRVEQAYLCPTCDVTVFTMTPNVRAPLAIGFGMKKSCPSCSAHLLP